jgi:hypothetical protein
MGAHDRTAELLGAWALDGVESGEAAAIEEHLRECDACAAEAHRLRGAAGWLGAGDVRPAPPGLRDAVLGAAMRRRPPTLLRTLTRAYAAQVELLDEALGAVGADAWHLPDGRHGDVRGMVTHLTANDAMLTADLGGEVLSLPVGDVRAAWRRQADVLLARLTGLAAAPGGAAAGDLDRPVRLAARARPPLRPLRDALVQRAFETWTHREDLGRQVGGDVVVPPPAETRRIVGLAVAVLPDALRAAGLVRPGAGVQLVLRGPAEGEWVVPLGHTDPVSQVEVTVRGDAVAFTRLVAGRHPVPAFDADVTGPAAVARAFLDVAATLGCD